MVFDQKFDHLHCAGIGWPVFWSYCRWSQFVASSRWSRSHSLRRKSGRSGKISTPIETRMVLMAMTITMITMIVMIFMNVMVMLSRKIRKLISLALDWKVMQKLDTGTWNTALSKSRPACNDANKSGEEQIMRASHPPSLFNDQTVSNSTSMSKVRIWYVQSVLLFCLESDL